MACIKGAYLNCLKLISCLGCYLNLQYSVSINNVEIIFINIHDRCIDVWWWISNNNHIFFSIDFWKPRNITKCFHIFYIIITSNLSLLMFFPCKQVSNYCFMRVAQLAEPVFPEALKAYILYISITCVSSHDRILLFWWCFLGILLTLRS